jgi:hypothetical protein
MNTDPRLRQTDATSPGIQSSNRQRTRWIASTGVLLLLLLALLAGRSRADFGLAVTPSTTNTLLVTITNADPAAAYQLDRSPSLDPSYLFWTPHKFGATGQTNFTVDIGLVDPFGFFRAQPCLDCDQDGVPNTQDANPFNTNFGILSVTIDSPINGAVIQ